MKNGGEEECLATDAPLKEQQRELGADLGLPLRPPCMNAFIQQALYPYLVCGTVLSAGDAALTDVGR